MPRRRVELHRAEATPGNVAASIENTCKTGKRGCAQLRPQNPGIEDMKQLALGGRRLDIFCLALQDPDLPLIPAQRAFCQRARGSG